jgi:hypothetical protein
MNKVYPSSMKGKIISYRNTEIINPPQSKLGSILKKTALNKKKELGNFSSNETKNGLNSKKESINKINPFLKNVPT